MPCCTSQVPEALCGETWSIRKRVRKHYCIPLPVCTSHHPQHRKNWPASSFSLHPSTCTGGAVRIPGSCWEPEHCSPSVQQRQEWDEGSLRWHPDKANKIPASFKINVVCLLCLSLLSKWTPTTAVRWKEVCMQWEKLLVSGHKTPTLKAPTCITHSWALPIPYHWKSAGCVN